MLVDVYIIVSSTEATDNHLASVFSQDLFRVTIVNSSDIISTSTPCQLLYKECIDYDEYLTCLLRNKKSQNFTLIVRDTMITLLSEDDMASIITACLSYGDYDICYLNKWDSRCEDHYDTKQVHGYPVKISKLKNGSPSHAILISPQGKDAILGSRKMRDGGNFQVYNSSFMPSISEMISNKKMVGICVNPNIFVYDTDRIWQNEDYVRVMECQRNLAVGNSIEGDVDTQQSTLSVFWFIAIVLLVLFLAFVYTRCRRW